MSEKKVLIEIYPNSRVRMCVETFTFKEKNLILQKKSILFPPLNISLSPWGSLLQKRYIYLATKICYRPIMRCQKIRLQAYKYLSWT